MVEMRGEAGGAEHGAGVGWRQEGPQQLAWTEQVSETSAA